MTEALQFLTHPDHWRSLVEILMIWVGLYYTYSLFRGTRGAEVLTGLAILLLGLTLISVILKLEVIQAILKYFSAFLAVAVVVLFQPELRRALAELGSRHMFMTPSDRRESIETICQAAEALSAKKIGGLLALQRETTLRPFAESGVPVDCDATPEMLETIFYPNTPLHDGGVIIRRGRILAAACIFPLTQRTELSRLLGLRHRAALGITEESDAIAVVISEETGIISICHKGEIHRDFSPEDLREHLSGLLLAKNPVTPSNIISFYGKALAFARRGNATRDITNQKKSGS